MIVGMAVLIHHPRSMPERGTPAAPVFVRPVGIKNEPAALHFRVAQLRAAEARHLALVQGQVHVLRRISVEVIDI